MAVAIFSLNLSSVGKSTHAAGTAGAHLRYISRPSAASAIVAHAMPDDGNKARAWMDEAETGDRKNARLLDRIRVAIPRELTREERVLLIQAFCEDITGNRVPWFAALHQDGEDTHNPHAHVVVRDRDKETGKRVLRWSDSPRDRKASGLPENAVEMVRAKWELLANQALERAGHDARIDRRSLEAQGIERVPTVHVGPKAAHIDAFVHRPESKIVIEKRGGRERVVDYPMIDAGRTRKEFHAEIVDFNLERAARSSDFATRARAQLLREEISKDRNLERQLATEARRATLEERRVRAGLRAEKERLRAQERAQRSYIDAMAKRRFTADRDRQHAAHIAAREALKVRQNSLARKFIRVADITGTRRRHDLEERRALVAAQKAEMRELVSKYGRVRNELCHAVKMKTSTLLDSLQDRFSIQLTALNERRRAFEVRADGLRQRRAAERADAEARLDGQLRGSARDRLGVPEPKQEERLSEAFGREASPPARQERGTEPRKPDLSDYRRSGSRGRDPSGGLTR